MRLNGYGSEAELLAGVKDIAKEWYVDPTRREAFRAELETKGKVENFISEVYRHKTRERIWISESARLVRDRRTGKALYYEGSVREITETMKRLKLQDMFEKPYIAAAGRAFPVAAACRRRVFRSLRVKGLPPPARIRRPHRAGKPEHRSSHGPQR